jgi:hypothetical protein
LFGAKITIGGFALKILKKLKGAKFGNPFAFTVLAKQIGRGPMLPIKYWCNCGIGVSSGFMVIIILFLKDIK